MRLRPANESEARVSGSSPSASDRQRPRGGLIAARRHDGLSPEAGEGTRGIGRAGDHGAHRKAALPEPLQGLPPQRGLAAEEVVAAGHVEDEPVHRVEGDERGPAVAGLGHPAEQCRIGLRIVVGRREPRDASPGIREGQAGAQPERHGLPAHRGES